MKNLETIAFIPIKKRSTRVPGKNFMQLAGRPLYEHIINNAIDSQAFDEIYVDTDSEEIKKFASKRNCKIIDRPEYMTRDNINGNHLLLYDDSVVAKGDLLFQLFATAPFLEPSTINSCVNKLVMNSDVYDSIFTATEETGWFWFKNRPINYDPAVLPRSQDAEHLIKETTGLYGITREALLKYNRRIGSKPLIVLVPQKEALDLDTKEDFKYARYLINQG